MEAAAATAAGFAGDTGAACGGRVFPRHYRVRLAGPGPSTALPAFPAGARPRALADDGIARAIVERYGRLIGPWTDDPDDQ